MADAAAVILSAIEKLDSWLLQKADHRNDDHTMLCSLGLEMKDLLVGMAEKWKDVDNEMLYSLLVGVADLWDLKERKVDNDKLHSFLGEMEDRWELNCREKLHSLLVQMMDDDIDMEKFFSLAVEMGDLWEDSKGKLNIEELYSWLADKKKEIRDDELRHDDHAKLCSLRSEKKDLLVGMMEVWENDNEMLYRLLVEVADLWDVKEKKVDNDNEMLYSFLGEMDDLWEVNCREKLHSLLVQMLDLDPYLYTYREKLLSLAVEMADLWKDSKGKLNKEKLYSCLAKKTDLWEEYILFEWLEGMTLSKRDNRWKKLTEEDWKKCVEGVRNDLRLILDFLNKLEDDISKILR